MRVLVPATSKVDAAAVFQSLHDDADAAADVTGNAIVIYVIVTITVTFMYDHVSFREFNL